MMAKQRNLRFEEMDIVSKLKNEEKTKLNKESLVVSKLNPSSIDDINDKIKGLVAETYEAELKSVEVKAGSDLETRIKNTIIDYLNENNITFEPVSLKAEIVNKFMLSLSGYGILQPLIDDNDIQEIIIYGPSEIRYLKDGKYEKSDICFESEEKLKAYIDNILGRINRTINNSNSLEDGRLQDGSRVAVSGSALSPNGYTMNIRKFSKDPITLRRLVKLNSIDKSSVKLLKAIISAKLNFLISGGTSTGKTTLLNAMSQFIPEDENVISIEDNIELQLNRKFWLQLETRKPNLEGENEVTMEDLLVHLLRRSPDRIIVGEVRTGKVADTLMNAIQTGHDGTCTTIHANSPERCRARICKLASVASGQPYEAALDDFDHSIQVVVQLAKLPQKNRRVVSEIDFVNTDGTMTKLMEYDHKEDKFVHYKLPEELKTIFADRGVEL